MKQRVLFVCTGNSCRSQMAEGWLRQMAGERFEVFSAGTHPAAAVHPLAVEAMREIGVDISGQRPKDVEQFVEQDFDLVVTLCDHARQSCPMFPGGKRREHWGFEDPAAATGTEEERMAVHRRVRDGIRERLEGWLRR